MKVRVVSRLAVALVAASIVLAGHVPGASAQAGGPQKGGTLTWLFNAEPPGADPAQLREVPNLSPLLVQAAIFDELVYTDPVTLKVKPKIATSLTTADKGLTWTMKLHSGVRFSDGTPFDAAAVQYNWQRFADPANKVPFAPPAQEIASYEIPDPLTLKVTLKAADPLWDQLVARNLSTIGSPTALKAGATAFSSKPVGAGPFLLKEWLRGSSMTLVRNPDYWQKGKPYLDEIDVKSVSDDAARLNTMLSGGGQVALEGAKTNVDQFRAESKKFSLVSTPAQGGGNAIVFNLTKAPFNDVRVRQALLLTLDSAELVQRANFGDKTTVMTTIDEKTSPFYNPKLKLPKTDPAAAQKLVDQVVADQGGRPIEFTYLAFNVPAQVRMAEAIQAVITSKLKNVNMKIDSQSPASAVPRLATGDFQAALSTALRWTDPALDLPSVLRSTGAGLNFGKYANPSVDAALTQLVNTTDLKTKQQALDTIVQNVLKDAPYVWVARFQQYYAIDKTQVKNWNMYFDLRPFLEDVWMTNPKR
jgi:peptide/nickel transport system substrate-binding protein